ncbi:MAG: autotransporter outer membrane beta-barrel domain-containing protein [Ketobacter sp.]|nr:autotransporter outer membrane beta-barrel domain-containing protein [Ketobacter sp.]
MRLDNTMTMRVSATLLCLLLPAALLATENDDAFRDYINNVICLNPQGDLVVTCNAATITIGGSGSTLSQTGNTGTQGSNDLSARNQVDQAVSGDAEAIRIQQQRWGVFSNIEYRNLDRDLTAIENGFDGSSVVVTVGADYRVSSAMLVGFAGSYGDTDIEFNGDSGGVDSERYEWIAFANYQLNDALYVDGYAGLTQRSNDMTRSVRFGQIQYDAQGDFDSDADQWGLGAGYQFSAGPIALDVALRYDSGSVDVEAYEEAGGDVIENLNLRYEAQTIDSRTVTLALYSVFNVSLQSGVMAPYVRAEAVSEHEDEAREISSHLVVAPDAEAFVVRTDTPDDLYGTVGMGVQFVAPGGLMLYIDAASLVAHDFLNTWSLSSGFRLEL